MKSTLNHLKSTLHDSNALREINHANQHDSRYKTLPFGCVANVRKLRLNRKPFRSTKSKRLLFKQHGINFGNLHYIHIEDKNGGIYNSNITIGTLNTRSIKNKDQIVLHETIDKGFDALLVTETWLTENDGEWLRLTELVKQPYSIHSVNRTGSRGGGLALICKSNYKVSLISHTQTHSLEHATRLMEIRKKPVHITGIYHPPPKDRITNAMFINDLTDLLTNLLSTVTNKIILGDLNMHVEDFSDTDAVIFNNTMRALGLDQNVTRSTHIHGNILDLIFTEHNSSIVPLQCYTGSLISDHKLVCCILNIKKE